MSLDAQKSHKKKKKTTLRVLNDFQCPRGHTHEHLVDNLVHTVQCIDCKHQATKVRSIPNFQLPGNDPAGFPTEYGRWEKKRKQKMALEKKAAEA